MRRVSSLLVTTSVLVLGAASPALAKAQPTPPPDPTATAQQNPAQPTQNADAPADNAIVVTGLRRSLQSARNIKRNSDQVVDAVVAEDIGKLPDITVSDTAARIPGVQVERNGGEATRVLIRGFDNVYYPTTYNGRELFTAETRSVALQDFPAGAIAAVEAYKTSTANLVEPGVAGLLNVRSRRPFDFKGLEVNGSVWLLHPNQSRDNSINGNLLISDRWTSGDSEFGALINVSYTRIHYQDSVRRHGFFIAGFSGGNQTPDWPEIHYNEGNRWRPSVNAALQYRRGDLNLYAEGLWQGYREHQLDSMWAQPIWAGTDSNLVIEPGTNKVISGSVLQPGGQYETWGFKGNNRRTTNTYQFAVGGSYDAGPLRVSADFAHTYSHFKLRVESVDMELNTNNYSVNWFTGLPGGDGPTFQVVGLDPTNKAIYDYRGFFEDYQDPKGKDWQARVDFEYTPTGISFLNKLQWGARYVDRDASDTAGSFYWNLTARGGGPGNYCCGSMLGTHLPIPITAVPLDYQLLHSAFRGDNMPPFPTSWYAPTFDSVWSNLTQLRQFNIDLTGQGSINGPPVDPGRSFDINEKTLAGYAQANLRLGSGDIYADGILGMRVVRTTDDITGTQFPPSGAPTPVTFHNNYTNWLPNLNINTHFGRQWVLRLAATKTLTRPTFQQLNPSLHLDQPTGCSPGASNCFRTGSGGNPFLEPLRSNNYDASLEYYFSNTGFASVSAFKRDMKGFVLTRQFQYPDPDPATGLPLLVTGPVNTQKANIKGFEGQIRTFFDWDWLPTFARSFGIEANVSYIDATAQYLLFCPANVTPCVPGPANPALGLPNHPNATTLTLPIPDVSNWNFNLTGMYEHGPLSARLSYSWRGKYPEGGLSERDGFYTLQGRGRPSPRLDFSSSYTVNDKLTLFLDWTNIFPRPFKSDIVRVNYANGQPASTVIFPMVVRFEETILSGGVRFRFGGEHHAAPPPPMVVPAPVPAPVVEPAPPPPPPPPAPAAPERG